MKRNSSFDDGIVEGECDNSRSSTAAQVEEAKTDIEVRASSADNENTCVKIKRHGSDQKKVSFSEVSESIEVTSLIGAHASSEQDSCTQEQMQKIQSLRCVADDLAAKVDELYTPHLNKVRNKINHFQDGCARMQDTEAEEEHKQMLAKIKDMQLDEIEFWRRSLLEVVSNVLPVDVVERCNDSELKEKYQGLLCKWMQLWSDCVSSLHGCGGVG